MGDCVFTKENVSDAKRLVRGDFYITASWTTRKARPSILMIPGDHPEPEVQLIRAVMPKAHITAFDQRKTSVEKAEVLHVDQAVQGDLGLVGDKYASESFVGQTFDIANIDLCSHLSLKTVKTLEAVAPFCKVMSVFLSYSRNDHFDMKATWGDGWEKQYNSFIGRYRQLAEVGEHITKRMFCAWKAVVEAKAKERLWLQRVYLYRGHVIPMFGLVFQRSQVPITWDPFFMHVANEDLGVVVLDALTLYDTEFVCTVYDVNPRRIAAWKAHRTRRKQK